LEAEGDKMKQGWRKMHNEKLCNLCSTSQTTWMTRVKEGEMGWTWSRHRKAEKCLRRLREKRSLCRHRGNIKMGPTQVGCRFDSCSSVWGPVLFLANVIINLHTPYKAGIFWLAVWLLTSKDSAPKCRLANNWVKKRIMKYWIAYYDSFFCAFVNNQLHFITHFQQSITI
jgi:hypothetical protein